MATVYEVRIYNRSGAQQYVLSPRAGLLGLAYTKRVNEVGIAKLQVLGTNDIVAAMELDWQVEILRGDAVAGMARYTDFYGLFRDAEWNTDERGRFTFTATFADNNDWLSRAIVGYKTAVANRTQFTAVAAETIAKTLVTRNATSSGTTADGRVRDVDPWGANITVQADGGTGNALNFTCAYRPLLSTLQDLAKLGGGDFAMVKTGAQAWQFRWYNGQLGTDRSATLRFAPELNNVANPRLRRLRSQEATVAIVGGQDSGTARNVAVTTSLNYQATYNSREIFVDARDQATANLVTRGDTLLEVSRARDELTFDVLQTNSTLYGRDYQVGDLVTGSYGGVSATKQVRGVTVTYAVGNANPEDIRVELSDL